MTSSYYESSANPRRRFPMLAGDQSTDICVIGGGYTGLLTALELAERGQTVILLEAMHVGAGASGQNGGQIANGFSPGMIDTAEIVGEEDAAKLWALSVEATALLKSRISRHDIACDLKKGEIYAATRESHRRWLLEEKELCEDRYGYQNYRWIEAEELPGFVGTERYCGALLDLDGGHLHPLNYALGLADAAHAAGVRIFEQSAVRSFDMKARKGMAVVRCSTGRVYAEKVVLACNGYLGDLSPRLARRIIPVNAAMIATEPLGKARACKILPSDACVADTEYNLDYFRLSADYRLLYGGRDRMGTPDPEGKGLIANMLKTFPDLEEAEIDFVWGGKVAMTRRMLPDMGRIGANLYYAQGYSGQGLPLSAIAGRLLADAIMGDAGRFDIFARIPHQPFPGGTRLRTPLLALAMFWYRLRDLL